MQSKAFFATGLLLAAAAFLSGAPSKGDRTAAHDGGGAGSKLYSANCAACHGESGKGNGKMAHDLPKQPSDLTDSDSLPSTDEKLFHDISIAHRPMPGFEHLLSREDRWEIVGYVRDLSVRK